jgi:hypothetical protein
LYSLGFAAVITGKIQLCCAYKVLGGASVMSTDKASLKSRQISISSNEIPKTFQDAIKVTRWLGSSTYGLIPFALSKMIFWNGKLKQPKWQTSTSKYVAYISIKLRFEGDFVLN